jgi:hypothetical protein
MLKVLSSHGLKPSRNRLFEAYDGSAAWLQTAWLTRNEISTLDQARRIATEAVGSLPANGEFMQELENAYVKPVIDLPPRLSDEAIETLNGMNDRSIRIGENL